MNTEDKTSLAPDPARKSKKAGDAFLSNGVPSHYNDQLIEISILQRVLREVAAWRRAFFVVAFLTLLTTTGFLIEATKSHVEAVVYREDASGDIALIGLTSKNGNPTEPSINNALRIYISAYRNIPAGNGTNNKDLIELNARQVRVMTDHDSPAESAYSMFVHEDNPIDLSRKGYSRTVTDVDIDKIADLTYRISWRENLRNGADSRGTNSAYTGTVQLATAPKVPADLRLGALNPTGTFVYSSDLRAPTLH